MQIHSDFFHRKLVKPLAATLTLAAFVSLPLVAANKTEHPPIVLSDVEARISATFNEADTDGDGRLSATEAATLRKPDGHRRGPHKAHANGKMGKQKMGKHRKGMRHQTSEQRATFQEQLFSTLDTDGNGQLSRSEWSSENRRAAKKELFQQQRFARLDADNSGFVESNEFGQQRLARLRAADVSGDGVLSAAELDTMRAARKAERQARRAQRHAQRGAESTAADQ